MRQTKIYLLAKELGVKASDIIKRCQFEGEKLLEIKHMMSPVPRDVAAKIREWCKDGHICPIQFVFEFEITDKFLNASTHPITIIEHYNSLLKQHIKSKHHEIEVTTSKHTTVSGYIYYYERKSRLYYQIKIPQQQYNAIPEQYREGRLIDVEVKIYEKNEIKVYLREK
ncbi:hypothetical protein KA005_36145 [bacterium]|nr:hypothetical protein [bacterium]